MAAERSGVVERVESARHCQLPWLTELQSVVYQLQLALSENKKMRGVTLTTLKFWWSALSPQIPSLKAAAFPQKSYNEAHSSTSKLSAKHSL